MTFLACHVYGWYSRWGARDGMSTPQNGTDAYSQSHISRTCQGGFLLLPCSFHLPECPSPMVGPPQLQRLSSDLTVFSQQPAMDAYSQSHVSRICQRGFLLPSLQFSSSWVSFSYGRSSPTAEAFLWPHCLQPAASFWCRLCMSGLRDATELLVHRSTLVGLWFNTAAPFPLACRYTLCLNHPP